MKIQKAVALRICNLLNDNKITQYELSKRTAMEQSTISKIIDEKTKTIKVQTILRIATAFNLNMQEFFNDKLFNDIEE